ncbi:MAG: aminotransferase class V-fold PLP-dependent enzyme, partial [Eubacteriales bacterium]|nr:aminotransferase class V-fold PLP-dependent enzyme [Eubacteriales bacterium]
MQTFITDTVRFYNEMEQGSVCRHTGEKSYEHLRSLPIPEEGRALEEVYGEMLQEVYADMLLPQHQRFFSCIPSTASLLSWMGDVMTNAFNPHASCKINAPAADLIEKKLIAWMCGLAGYPVSAGGLFVSGGSVANLTALTAARDAKLETGERDRAVIYLSDQTHSSVAKDLHIIGFYRDQIRIIPSDAEFRMDITKLKEAVEADLQAGKKPFAVVASAGSTNTGSVDPMTEIAHICRSHDMWMHVDGAFGASALLSEKQRKKLAGIEYSDSLSWDAHKWLMQTYGCSVVLVRDQKLLVNSFAAHPEYLKDAENDQSGIEFWDLGPELTRPARHLKLWLTLQTMGSREFSHVIDHGCMLAEFAEKLVGSAPGWELISPAKLGIVNFRYISNTSIPEAELDDINQKIAREISESGYAQIFTTQLHGKRVIRLCTINPQTTEEDIRETFERMRQSKAVKKSRELL